jgi:hypothetical protein
MSDTEDKPVPLFQDNSAALIAQGDAAAVARATQEIQAALVIAQRCPRDEVRAKARIIEACKRRELAESAEYEYSRAGTRITGPSIDLLRAVANRWGNVRFGWSEANRESATDRDSGRSLVRCFAWDTQSNAQAERTFYVLHWRDTQAGGYALKDERDIYELIANQAARRVRACLQEVIDSDIVDAAVEQCRETLRKGERVPLMDRAVQMVAAFAEFGVTQPMIEVRIGKLEAVSENQLASLRRVYKSLKDGVGKREDYFKAEVAKPDFTPPAAAAPPQPAGSAAGEPESFENAKPASQTAQFNALKALANLCKMASVPEGKLLEFLAAQGATDGSPASLEELVMTHPGVAKATCDQWADVSAKIKAAMKGGAK